jgi:hypothetical protein
MSAPGASSAHRFGVYLLPADAWLRLGTRWLGRDALTGERVPRGLDEVDAAVEVWTQAPRLYGLHATLKPPFRLAPGMTADALDAEVRQLARAQTPFEMSLCLTQLRGFLAWCEDVEGNEGVTPDAAAGTPVTRLADACVAQLDHFRAPASEQEIARRRNSSMTPEQDANLLRWGYPYVFDTFTFHMTLSGRLDEASMKAAVHTLKTMARPEEMRILTGSARMPVYEMGLFVQPEPDAPFVIARSYGFDGATRDGAGAKWLTGGLDSPVASPQGKSK